MAVWGKYYGSMPGLTGILPGWKNIKDQNIVYQFFSILNSTLLFSCLPSSVSLVAIGFVSP
jgi:hypothetical protein